jgi:hypothetical protein
LLRLNIRLDTPSRQPLGVRHMVAGPTVAELTKTYPLEAMQIPFATAPTPTTAVSIVCVLYITERRMGMAVSSLLAWLELEELALKRAAMHPQPAGSF